MARRGLAPRQIWSYCCSDPVCISIQSYWTRLSHLVSEAATGRRLETASPVSGTQHSASPRRLVLCILRPLGSPLGIKHCCPSLRRAVRCRDPEESRRHGRHLPFPTVRRAHLQPDFQSLSLEPRYLSMGAPMGGPHMSSSLSDPQHRHCRNCSPFGVFVWPSISRIRGDSSISLSYVARNPFNGLITYRRPSVFSQYCPLHLR